MDNLPVELLSTLQRFLPECPDQFCNDFQYVEAILLENKDDDLDLFKDELRPYYIYGWLKSIMGQRKVDNLTLYF